MLLRVCRCASCAESARCSPTGSCVVVRAVGGVDEVGTSLHLGVEVAHSHTRLAPLRAIASCGSLDESTVCFPNFNMGNWAQTLELRTVQGHLTCCV